jgi:hypothetical protein
MRKGTMLVLTLCILLLAVGCASKPVEQQTGAQKALEDARSAEADLYAAELYQVASESLKAAEAEMVTQDGNSAFSRDYEKAEELLAAAQTQAENARVSAATNKERVRAEAEVEQAEAEQALETAQTTLSKAPRGKGTKADLEALAGDLSAAESALSDARSAYANGKYRDALNGFRAVKEKCQGVCSEVEQAIQKKKI